MITFRPSRTVARIQEGSLRPTSRPGPEVVSLAMGEPDFDTPAPVIAAGVEALRAGYTHYAHPSGDPELREAIASAVADVAKRPCGVDEVLVTHGGTAGLAAAILGTVDPGDRVVIPEPTYSLYADLVQMAGGVPVHVPTGPDHHLDLERIAAALPGARLIVLCNPGNPTGAVYRADELERLAALLDGTETLLLSDEAYDAIVYEGHRFTSALALPALRPRLIYCQTLSKTYAMTGWRIGYLAAPAPIIGAAACIHRTTNGAVNAAVQRAALAAVRQGRGLADPMLAAYARRRAFTMERIARIDGLEARAPEGTFYVFARYAVDLPSTVVTQRLLDAGVAVRAGAEYGPSGEHHIRLSFATSIAQLEEGLSRIDAALRRMLDGASEQRSRRDGRPAAATAGAHTP